MSSSLVTHTPAAEVTGKRRVDAASWEIWDSSTHDDGNTTHLNGGTQFDFDYSDNHAEHVVVIEGEATLTHAEGEVKLEAGDSIIFWRGFKCRWNVTSPMKKHYQYFDSGGNMVEPIHCDGCNADCWAESYFTEKEEDVCPTCFAKGGWGKGEHQRHGKTIVEEEKASVGEKRKAGNEKKDEDEKGEEEAVAKKIK